MVNYKDSEMIDQKTQIQVDKAAYVWLASIIEAMIQEIDKNNYSRYEILYILDNFKKDLGKKVREKDGELILSNTK